MKRMITQELIDKIIALFGNIIASADQITIMSKLHLLDVTDIEVSDLGSLFPTPEDDKLLAWDDGVLKNVSAPSGGTQLYSHRVQLSKSDQFPSSAVYCTIINCNDTPITYSSLKSILTSRMQLNEKVISVMFQNSEVFVALNAGSTIGLSKFDTTNGGYGAPEEYEYIFGTDTITPL